MYLSGQRGLPSRSKLKYEKLVVKANESFVTKREKLEVVHKQESEFQNLLENLIQDNKLKQLQTQKKLTRMKEQFEAALNTMHFVDGFQNRAMNETVMDYLEIKAIRVLDKNALMHQEVLTINLEVLKHEETLLVQRLKKLS